MWLWNWQCNEEGMVGEVLVKGKGEGECWDLVSDRWRCVRGW